MSRSKGKFFIISQAKIAEMINEFFAEESNPPRLGQGRVSTCIKAVLEKAANERNKVERTLEKAFGRASGKTNRVYRLSGQWALEYAKKHNFSPAEEPTFEVAENERTLEQEEEAARKRRAEKREEARLKRAEAEAEARRKRLEIQEARRKERAQPVEETRQAGDERYLDIALKEFIRLELAPGDTTAYVPKTMKVKELAEEVAVLAEEQGVGTVSPAKLIPKIHAASFPFVLRDGDNITLRFREPAGVSEAEHDDEHAGAKRKGSPLESTELPERQPRRLYEKVGSDTEEDE